MSARASGSTPSRPAPRTRHGWAGCWSRRTMRRPPQPPCAPGSRWAGRTRADRLSCPVATSGANVFTCAGRCLLHAGVVRAGVVDAGVVDADAVIMGKAREAGRVALPDGAKLPTAAAPVQLAQDEGR